MTCEVEGWSVVHVMVVAMDVVPLDATAEITGAAVVVNEELVDVPVSVVEVFVEATSKS